MQRNCFKIFFHVTIALIVLLTAEAGAGTIDPGLRKKLAALGPDDEVPVIVNFSGRPALDTALEPGKRDKRARRTAVIAALKERSAASEKPFREFLKGKAAKKLRSLWIKNAAAVTAPRKVIEKMAGLPGIESITADLTVYAPTPVLSENVMPEWNIERVKAPLLWNRGIVGQGAVVATMDTGVDLQHPDLTGRWRGGTNSWFDPYGQHAIPYDYHGHGTATMGVMVGGSAGETAIGIAPGAQWIAVKIWDDNDTGTLSAIHQGFQWLLDPDGNPSTDDAPDVVNNSWSLCDESNNCVLGCITEFQPDIQTLRAAGIAVVFSAGNSGPNTSTSESPANNPGSFAVGASDYGDNVALFSSRGPSSCDGGIFPHVVAPGSDIWTADLSFGGLPSYAAWEGTSFSAPHVAGAVAMLRSAFPKSTVAELEDAIKRSARDLGPAGPDNDAGYGLLDIEGAYKLLNRGKIGVFRNGKWYLDNGSGTWNVGIDTVYSFGLSTDIPITGDWDGSGSTKIGTFRSGKWYLDNGNGRWDAGIDSVATFGMAGDIPITGNWNADAAGKTKIGVFRAGKWYLDMNDNDVWDTGTDAVYSFGLSTDIPITGDWDGSGSTKIGTFRSGKWYLDNGNGRWDAGIDSVATFGMAGDIPITGDWNGDGRTEIGVLRGGTWYLDLNGNGKWDAGIDGVYSFGMTGDIPVAGRW
ncbi:MAG: S8 family serine peptidase [Nitrospirota bacterium]